MNISATVPAYQQPLNERLAESMLDNAFHVEAFFEGVATAFLRLPFLITDLTTSGPTTPELNTAVNTPYKEKVHQIFQEVKGLMGITQKIHLNFKENGGSASISQQKNLVFVTFGIQQLGKEALTDKEIRFVIAHELAHFKNGDTKRSHKLDIIVLAVSAIALTAFIIVGQIFIGIAVFFLISGVAKLMKNQQQSSKEMAADMLAIKTINDAQGGISYFETLRQRNIQRRTRPITNESHIMKCYEYLIPLISKKTLITQIAPNGNNRKDTAHPSITERIAYMKQFNYA